MQNETLMDLISRQFPPKGAFVMESTVQFQNMIGNAMAKMEFKTIVDTESSRVKIDTARKLFAFGSRADLETTVIHYEKQRMMVSNEEKKMCLKYDIKESTPISINIDQVNVKLNTS